MELRETFINTVTRNRSLVPPNWVTARDSYCATTAGGCQVPFPAGRIDGASVFGQYRRITK